MKYSGYVLALTICPLLVYAQAVYAGRYFEAERKTAKLQSGNMESSSIEDAIARYCRTLRINPRGKTIRENLSAMLTSPRVTAEEKSEALRIGDLLDHITKLQRHITLLAQKRDRLKRQLVEEGHDAGKLKKGLADIRQRSDRYDTNDLSSEGLLEQDEGPLEHVSRALVDEKQRLSRQLQNTQEQGQWLQALQRGGESPDSSLPHKEFADQSTPVPSISIAKKEFQEAPGPSALPAPELSRSRKSESGFGQTLSEKDTKIDKLSDQLVDLSLKMEETQALLREKDESMDALKERLNDIEQRFLLEQRIIQDKDEEIKKLRDGLSGLPAPVIQPVQGERETSQTQRAARTELSDAVRSAEAALASSKAMLHEKGNLLGVLEKELADVQEKYKLDQKMLGEKNQQIERLRQELLTAHEGSRDKATEMDPVLSKKEKEIKALNGVINIYQYALEDSIRAIREKDEDLNFLNHELAKLQDLFHDNGKRYDQRDARIHVLKEALKHERNQEDQRNINLRKMVQSKNEEINVLKAQLAAAERNLEVASRVIQEKTAYLDYAKRELAAYRANPGGGPEASGASYAWEEPVAPPMDQQMAELSSMLNIYREKLSDEHKSAKEKSVLISTLEGRLGDMQFQIDAKDKILAQTQSDLRSLKERLEAVEVELMNLKESPLQNGWRDRSVDHKVSELQTQFKDIQHFLLENPHGFDRMNARMLNPRLKP